MNKVVLGFIYSNIMYLKGNSPELFFILFKSNSNTTIINNF